MHDCQTTNERLLDLAVNELAGPDKFALLAELQGCGECRAEYHSLHETWRAVERAGRAVAPPEIYWEGYQSKLRQQLRALEVAPESAPPVARWRRWLAASVRVPVPAAAAAALLLAAVGVWLARPSNNAAATPAVENLPSPQTPQVVYVTKETPAQTVVRERVVTRTVYVPGRAATNNARGETAPASNSKPPNEPAALAGFQPPHKVEMRVIKGDSQEK
jgi:hypothetical protein